MVALLGSPRPLGRLASEAPRGAEKQLGGDTNTVIFMLALAPLIPSTKLTRTFVLEGVVVRKPELNRDELGPAVVQIQTQVYVDSPPADPPLSPHSRRMGQILGLPLHGSPDHVD